MSYQPLLWDISAPVHASSPVYPGDTPYEQRWSATIGPDSAVNVSTLTLSPHIGTHADAPLHYDNQGAAIGAVPLEPFMGPCRVIHAMGCGPLIEWRHIAHAISADLPPRVLLVGIDTASVDPADSRELPSHQVLRRRGLRVLENLVLDAVPEVDYELIALPLKLTMADASPVRAVLRALA